MIIKLGNDFDCILEELGKIHSNEKFRPIDKRLLNVVNFDSIDFQLNEKLYFLGDFRLNIAESFLKQCKSEDSEACIILFNSHAELAKKLIELGFSPRSILLVGLRNLKREEIIYLSEKNIRTVHINDLTNNLEDATDIIMEFSSGKQLYVSFDMNVIDPAFVPASIESEVGGLTSREAIYIVSRIGLMKNLRCFEIKGIDSEKDKKYQNLSVKLGAKLLAELL